MEKQEIGSNREVMNQEGTASDMPTQSSNSVILSAASRFASRIEIRSRRTPAIPPLYSAAARHSPRVRVGRTLLSAAFDVLAAFPIRVDPCKSVATVLIRNRARPLQPCR